MPTSIQAQAGAGFWKSVFESSSHAVFTVNYPHKADDGDHRWTDGAGHHFTPNAEAKMRELLYLFD